MRTLKALVEKSGAENTEWFRNLDLALEIDPSLARHAAKFLISEAERNGTLTDDEPFFPEPTEEQLAGEITIGETVRLKDI